jgi:hypothetical protein
VRLIRSTRPRSKGIIEISTVLNANKETDANTPVPIITPSGAVAIVGVLCIASTPIVQVGHICMGRIEFMEQDTRLPQFQPANVAGDVNAVADMCSSRWI